MTAEGIEGSKQRRVEVLAPISWWPRSAPRRRLIGFLVAYGSELSERLNRLDAGRRERETRLRAWAQACESLLAKAQEHALRFRGSVSVGNQALNAAQRLEILDYDADEVRAAALVLSQEAQSGKLNKWRQDSIVRLLRVVSSCQEQTRSKLAMLMGEDELAERLAGLLRAENASERRPQVVSALTERGLPQEGADAVTDELLDECGDTPTPEGVRGVIERLASGDEAPRVFLRYATLIRDEGLQNNYRKTDILKQNLWIISGFLSTAIAGVLLLASFLPLDLSEPSTSARRELGGSIMAYIPLFGIIGASLSATLSLIRTALGRGIPEIYAHGVVTLVRPLFGAGSALAVYVLVASGLQDFVSTSNAAVLFVALAAGFSERLIVRAVTAVSGDGQASQAAAGSGT